MKKKQGFYSQLPDEEKKKICLECLRKASEEQEKIMKEYDKRELINDIACAIIVFIFTFFSLILLVKYF